MIYSLWQKGGKTGSSGSHRIRREHLPLTGSIPEKER